ncbi:hypothetical protein CAC42_1734 [Sphaceloma murrayae]|uniref:Cyclase n=1 Tax=Sphaceloma murrayae TaxID=2082308 RepID=A0A2K1QIJ5_9PEZI|nr:hypothetical protein CAC42_1734 [Sphaceloma murrayae]
MAPIKVPRYSELPIQEGAPKGSAWGVFDKGGQKDVYGTLNFITPEAVLAAKEEIKLGQSVVLNLPMHLPYYSPTSRKPLTHTPLCDGGGMKFCDDEIHLNTQGSSQWDGLLHWPRQDTDVFYNGATYEDAGRTRTDKSLAIQNLSERGGIVARGILLDFVRYAAAHNIEYNPMSPFAITLAHVKAMIAEQAVEIRQGDILLVRMGVSKYLRTTSKQDQIASQLVGTGGLDATPDLIEWLWDSNFAAVGSDSMAVEAIPASDGSWLNLHTAAIPGWGMMLGELLDLEALAALTEEENRWTFFLTICPLNLEGGAATVANTLAIM